jgi:hypothetical protein
VLDWVWVRELVNSANTSWADVLRSLLSRMAVSRVVVGGRSGCLGILRLSWRFVGLPRWRQARAGRHGYEVGRVRTADKLWK